MLFSLNYNIAQVSLATMDVSVTENFNQTDFNVSSFNLTDNTSIPGVYVSRAVGNAVPNVITRTAGGVNSGNLYNFGTASTDNDRALGGIYQSTTGILNYGIRYKNNTGSIITSLVVTYTGEQWRTGTGNVVNSLSFDYRQAPSVNELLSGTYVAVSALNFASPIISSTGTALDGHASANSKTLTATIAVIIPIGEEIMLRWTDVDDTALDCALGIDDIIVTPKAATKYYYSGTGSLANVANWGKNTNGTGSNPPNFTNDFQLFQICNTTAVTTDATWAVSGAGSKVILGILGSPTPPITLTLALGTSIETSPGGVDVTLPTSGNHKIVYKNSVAVSIGANNDPNLELVYDGATLSTATSRSYGNVSIINNAKVNMSSAQIVVKNLSIEAGSELSGAYTSSNYIAVKSGGKVTINGTFKTGRTNGLVSANIPIPVTTNITNNAILFESSETLTLGAASTIEYYRGTTNNTGVQTIEARTYANLTLSNSGAVNNKTFATGTVTVNGNLTINLFSAAETVSLSGQVSANSLTLTSGKVILGTHNLITSSIAGGSATSYVVTDGEGALTRKNFTGATTYPVGPSLADYTPASVKNNASARDFSAKVGAKVTNPGNASKVVNLQWEILPSNLAANNADITLQWNTNNQGSSFDNKAAVYMARYNKMLLKWEMSKATTVSGTNPFTATATGYTEFSSFALGNASTLPVRSIIENELALKVKTTLPTTQLDIIVGNEINAIRIYDMSGQQVLSIPITIGEHTLDISNLNSGLYIILTDKGQNCRFVKL